MTQSILHYARMAWPTSWADLYEREAPLLLEIGFGTGHYLIDWARRQPECNVLGMEISLPSLRRGAKKMQTAALTNLRILQTDSRTALWILFPQRTISKVVINFPDPWPKANHQHRQLINDNFLHLLSTRMVGGADLDVATDHADYAIVIADCLQRSPYFDNRLQVPHLTEDNARLRTKYEMKALAEGRKCKYFKFRRNSQVAPNPFLIPEVSAVPHVVLSCPLDLEEIGRQFEPRLIEAGSMNLKYLNAFKSTKDGLLLVEVYVSEDPFHQRVCLSIRSRQGGDLVVGLSQIGFPRPTEGIHLAIYHLVQWLRTLHGDISVVTSTLNVPINY